MNITLDEAIRIHARASVARFGSKAKRRTQERIEQLAQAGDVEGVRVWEKVKRQIKEIERRRKETPRVDAVSPPIPARRVASRAR
ncbi:MAG: hypothetical protein JOY94_06015 [Methylobacteriaceae bacterium]|nr:hypothetical protein [Methylobacteriaceae bacterium]MBV9218953.1 hypothetical protein [Methylobacteriaceae bacterium]MBV9636724.1 hypothetical protein [Methylobacteriaceae bacterium]